MTGEPARHGLDPARAIRGERLGRQRGGLRVERAARVRDREPAPALGLGDDVERRAPVLGVRVADQRDRRALLHAERARPHVPERGPRRARRVRHEQRLRGQRCDRPPQRRVRTRPPRVARRRAEHFGSASTRARPAYAPVAGQRLEPTSTTHANLPNGTPALAGVNVAISFPPARVTVESSAPLSAFPSVHSFRGPIVRHASLACTTSRNSVPAWVSCGGGGGANTGRK